MREDELVAAIAAIAASPAAGKIALGIGDDAALWQPSRSHRSAISTDMLVEGVDFARELMTLEDAGWRAMVSNASDLAAMGARPVLATVALGAPPEVAPADLLDLYRGVAAAAKAYGLAIAGGDLSRAPVLTVAIAVVGEVRAADAKRRDGGHPGDVVAVTGDLGAARAGLELASNTGPRIDAELAAGALRAFRRPQARCAEGRFLAASRNVTAMLDCSDGLSTDLHRLCAASNCGAAIERVPVAPAAQAVAARTGSDPVRYALDGGEDFELIVTVRPRAFAHLALRFEKRFGRALRRVGTLRPQAGVVMDGNAVEPNGWDHFVR